MRDLLAISSISDITNKVNSAIGLGQYGGSGGYSQASTPAGLISQFLTLGFVVAGFLMFVWAIIGVFQYILAGGNKENLAKARARITWAIVGFLITIVSFALSQYIQSIFTGHVQYTF